MNLYIRHPQKPTRQIECIEANCRAKGPPAAPLPGLSQANPQARVTILVCGPLPTVPLVARRRCLIVVPRSKPTAPRRFLIRVPRPLHAAPLVVRRRNLIVAPRPLPAAPLDVRRRNLIVVPRPLPAVPLVVRRRSLIVVPRLLLAVPRTIAAGEEQLGKFSAEQRKGY